MYKTFSFSLSLSLIMNCDISLGSECINLNPPNSNFRYFFFLFWLCVSFFGKIKILLPLLWHSPMGSSPLDPPPSSPFFRFPSLRFFFLFPIRPDTHTENGFVVVVVCTDRFERGLNWMDSSSQIQFDNNILRNLPVPPSSGRRYRRNQIKWKRKKRGKGKTKFKSTEKMLSNFIPQ